MRLLAAAPVRPTLRGWAEHELELLSSGGLRRRLEPLESRQGPVVKLGDESLINFSSNDYLGLAADPRLEEAAATALKTYGVGAGASRLVVGDTTAHQSLERKLCAFERAEAALLFNSGYAANLGVVSALFGAGDVVFSDALNHASLIDGCRLSRAEVVVYPHLDVDALSRQLKEHRGRRALVCTESVFSMDGDRAPLEELVQLCQSEGATLLVDEAHATGVFGHRGAGLCGELGLEGSVDLRIGTLGKALGVFGAYVTTSQAVRELLIHRARSLVFSTALPPSVCAAAERAVGLVEEDGGLRRRLWRNIERFSAGLNALGLTAVPRSAIFPLVLGDAARSVEMSQKLRARGVLVKPIRPPTVPRGTSRLRFALSAAHTDDHLDAALAALRELV